MNYENLELGSTGDNVKILQEKLKILGLYNPIVSGSFSLATLEGVKEFQRKNNLEVTGIVDYNTWQQLLAATSEPIVTIAYNPILSLGSSGELVSELQVKLKTLLYYMGNINGTFDLETQNAVKRLQYNNDITTTGIVNDQTWNIINQLYGNLNSCVTGSESNNENIYIVQRGDTLYSIAQKYNVTVEALKNLNNLTTNILSIGQILRIPVSQENEGNQITYVVQRGDTLYSIAQKYNVTVEALKKLNNLITNILSIGQILRIPVSQENEGNQITYIVQRGDTLYSIAQKYNITVEALKNLNNLTTNILSIGQILKIPVSQENEENQITYIVQRGDTLYSIARKYNVTVEALNNLNNLTTNILSIGQILKIPNS